MSAHVASDDNLVACEPRDPVVPEFRGAGAPMLDENDLLFRCWHPKASEVVEVAGFLAIRMCDCISRGWVAWFAEGHDWSRVLSRSLKRVRN